MRQDSDDAPSAPDTALPRFVLQAVAGFPVVLRLCIHQTPSHDLYLKNGISLNLVSAFFGFLFPQRFVKDRRRRRCGNCGKAGAFFAEAFPNSLWKSSRRSRRRLPCSISTAAAVSTARCRPAQGCV